MNEILPRKWWTRKPAFLQRPELVQAMVMSVIVVLVGLGGFGLGRLTTLQAQKGVLVVHAPELNIPLAIETPKSANNTPSLAQQSTGSHIFVASKNGTKYYSAGCSGASRIKAANQVWFASAQAAAAAGYKLASNCTAASK